MTPEQRAARIHHHMYTTNEGIAEHAERIVALEELVADMWHTTDQLDLCRLCLTVEECDLGALEDICTMRDPFIARMRELGVEVTDE